MTELAESRERWWILIAAPAIWAAHFLLSYITAAIWCGRVVGPGGSLWSVRLAIAAYTAAALAGIVLVGWQGLRQHRHGTDPLPHDADTPEDRHRFFGFTALLLSAASGVAVIYAVLPALFIVDCH